MSGPAGVPGPGRQDQHRSDYPAIRTISTRWEDEDVYGHVNNVVYYSFFDTAVNGYLIDTSGVDIRAARRLRHRRRDELPVPAGAAVPR